MLPTSQAREYRERLLENWLPPAQQFPVKCARQGRERLQGPSRQLHGRGKEKTAGDGIELIGFLALNRQSIEAVRQRLADVFA